jgi:hypothetical protein
MPIKAIRAGFMRGFSTGSARIVPQPQRRSKPSRLASAAAAPQSTAMRRKARQATKAENRPRFWGRHAVTAALANPERRIARIYVSRDTAPEYDIGPDIPVTFAEAADLGRLVPGMRRTRASSPKWSGCPICCSPTCWTGRRMAARC